MMVVCSVQGQGEIGEIAPQLARDGEGLASAANPGDVKRSEGQANGPDLLLVRWVDYGAHRRQESRGLGIQ